MTLRLQALAATVIWVLAGGAAQGVLHAQENPPPLPVVEIQRLLDSYFALQAQEALDLSPEQYPQFLAKLQALQNVRLRNEQTRLKLIRELNNRLTNKQQLPSERQETELRIRLKALDDLEVSTAEEFRTARDELVQTLNIRQQARLRLLEEQMERQKLQLLLRARQRQAERRGQPPPPR